MDDGTASFRRVDRLEVPCLVVRGEIDLAVVDELGDAAAKLIGDAHARGVLDLTAVPFFGSTGVRALITAQELARSCGVDLVVEASDVVRRLLEITDLTDEFDLR